MCGLGGFSRAADRSSIPNGVTFARSISRAIEHRGPHATGFGWTQADGWPWYWKAPGRASKVAGLAPLPNGMRDVIVHTRYATKGDSLKQVDGTFVNCHPVHAPGLVLVHNGVLRNDDELIDMVGHTRLGEVDSEALPALLALGADALGESDPAELLALVKGDAAVAWLDGEEPGVLHLARLVGRPLAYGHTRRGDLVFASTAPILREIAARTSVGIDGIREVREGTYLKVVEGEIVRSTPIRVARHSYATARPQRPKPKQQESLEFDWDDLVPRRGWTVYRNDEPTGGRGKFRYDVKSQTWKEVE